LSSGYKVFKVFLRERVFDLLEFFDVCYIYDDDDDDDDNDNASNSSDKCWRYTKLFLNVKG